MNFRNKEIRIRSAAVIIEQNKLVLVAHKKNNNIYWLLPGGGVKFCEPVTAALHREVMEELGINIEVGELLFVSSSIGEIDKRHIINLCFRCNRIEGELHLGNDKRLHDYGYFNKEEIESMTIFPPIKNELRQILCGNQISNRFQEKEWIPL